MRQSVSSIYNIIFLTTMQAEELFADSPICHSGCSVYPKDFDSLSPGQWLRSEAIHILTTLLEQQHPNPKLKIIDPFITSMLLFVGNDCFESLQKQEYFTKYQYLIMPVNTEVNDSGKGSHWYLLVYHIKDQVLIEYDSVRQDNNYQTTKCLKQRIEGMIDLFCYKKVQVKINRAHGIPKQNNTFDCGVFTVGFVEAILQQLEQKQEIDYEGIQISQQFDDNREKYRSKVKAFLIKKSKQIIANRKKQ